MLGRDSKAADRGSDHPADRLTSKREVTLLAVQGDHAKFEGRFEIADSVEIQCEIGGELEVGGQLIIGEKGTVHADVRTVDAIIMGTYAGDMVATGDVQITSTGNVTGNLQTDSLVISKGGFFNGNVRKSDDEPAEPVQLVEDDDDAASPDVGTAAFRTAERS